MHFCYEIMIKDIKNKRIWLTGTRGNCPKNPNCNFWNKFLSLFSFFLKLRLIRFIQLLPMRYSHYRRRQNAITKLNFILLSVEKKNPSHSIIYPLLTFLISSIRHYFSWSFTRICQNMQDPPATQSFNIPFSWNNPTLQKKKKTKRKRRLTPTKKTGRGLLRQLAPNNDSIN